MTKDEEDLAELKSLLEEAESRPLTKDEVKTVYKITHKRIQRLEQKAVNRLLELSKKKKPNPEDNSADSDTSPSNEEFD